jgi:hypothetical protein
MDRKPLATAELRLVNGEILRFVNSIEDKNKTAHLDSKLREPATLGGSLKLT